MEQERTEDQRGERGTVMVIAALAMSALLLFAALAIDVGAIWLSRTQNQNANDSAALAAAQKMLVPGANPGDPSTVDLDAAIAEGQLYAGANPTVGEAVTQDMAGNRFGGVTVTNGDFTFGKWDLATQTFTPLTTAAELADPEKVRAVRVDVRMDGNANARSPAFLSRLLGISGYDVHNDAIAYLGFAGSFKADGSFDLPVALDQCQITTPPPAGEQCGDDFCEMTARSATCSLLRSQAGTYTPTGLICGEFSSTGQQNMCFTALDQDPQSPTPQNLKQIVCDRHFYSDPEAGDPVTLNNGDISTVVDNIRDRFYGCGEYAANGRGGGGNSPNSCAGGLGPAGATRYGTYRVDPNTGQTFPVPDSWIVHLPVVECQSENHCSNAESPKIVGGTCFEIREVIAPQGLGQGQACDNAPEDGQLRWIKGRTLCKDSPNEEIRTLYNLYCVDPNEPPPGPGGCALGKDAQYPVLVQ